MPSLLFIQNCTLLVLFIFNVEYFGIMMSLAPFQEANDVKRKRKLSNIEENEVWMETC